MNLTNDTAKLARAVIIDPNGTLILGQNPNNSGANNPNIILAFGTIINRSTASVRINANTPAIFDWTSASNWENFRGLHIMANAPLVNIDNTIDDNSNNSNSDDIVMSNDGYCFINGTITITTSSNNVDNASLINSANGTIVVDGGIFDVRRGIVRNLGAFTINFGTLHFRQNFQNQNSATFSVTSGGVVNVYGNLANNNNATFSVTSGVVNVYSNLANSNSATFSVTSGVVNAYSNLANNNSANFSVNGGVVNAYSSVINTATSGQFNITSGKFIMTGTPTSSNDSLITNRRIIVSNAGQFIIDQNRIVNMSGATLAQNGGLILEANTNQIADYLTLEALPDVTSDNVRGSFAMLKGSELSIYRDRTTIAGLINNNPNRNNVYFHRGKYRDVSDKPSLISFRLANIMPTIETNPYGILRTIETNPDRNWDYLGVNDEICIGGRSDTALWCVRADLYAAKNKIVFVDSNSNATYFNSFGTSNATWNGITEGTVERRTSIFGYATGINKNYCFTSRYAYFNFSQAGAALPRIALTTKWKTPPILVTDRTDANKTAQRYYSIDFDVNFDVTSGESGGEPTIQAISLNYLGLTEVNAILFSRRDKLMFGAGYDNAKQPLKIAKVTTAGVSSANSNNSQNQNYQYLAVNTNIVLKNAGSPQTASALVSGNELIMYLGSRFISARHGRWSNPDTWVYGIVPTKEDSVEIRHIVYTGLWERANQNLFGEKPYGAAEDKLYPLESNEALLAGKLRIVNPNIIPDEDGLIQANQPSALIIGASVNSNAGYNNNPSVMCQPMDFSKTLVFADNSNSLLGANVGIFVESGGSASLRIKDILDIAKSNNPNDWRNINGLYIMQNGAIFPTIRALNIINKGFIQNGATMEVGGR